MSQNRRTLVVAAVVITLGLLVLDRMLPRSTGQQIPNAVQVDQWEYHVDAGVSEPSADRLGKEGWELVTVFVQSDVAIRAVYKRPLR